MNNLPLDFIELEAVNPVTKDTIPNIIYLRACIIQHVESFTGPFNILVKTPNNGFMQSQDTKPIVDGALISMQGGNRIVYNNASEVMEKIRQAALS